MPDDPNIVRENYDRLAGEYAAHIAGELQNKPFDCEILTRFANETAGGEVCDLGCGPGHVTNFLRKAGASAWGVDLSPKMVENARRLFPDTSYRVDSMLDLHIADGTLSGVTAMYAIVNIDRATLPAIFREMYRVLRPAGLLLMSFHVGDETLNVPELWGQKVTMPFFLFESQDIRLLLEQAGFKIQEVLERDPYPDIEFQSRRAYIFARKPVSL